ncbi:MULTISPECIES: hypothetical protein [Leptospira]|uniref:Uncharacterized protein n=1 Tax=Leptospira licerasiae str. MMD4847 TaxID=1049971 RepID=A0ABN0HBX5_9LEPT|nr:MULTISPECIES: hypothetical protein [Leptospira]EIE01329.1 hypothetical protein LEP1GSC185_3457 [Leptospira licerasiae serovar Varillal str. VAR 010]EJZ43095.1 hypothetical protein LEP1GSC178_3071 [Leptospira licerasiae str. MMD4847]
MEFKHITHIENPPKATEGRLIISKKVKDEIKKANEKSRPPKDPETILQDIIHGSKDGIITTLTPKIKLFLVRFSPVHLFQIPFQVFVAISSTDDFGQPVTYIRTLDEDDSKPETVSIKS